MGEKDTTEKVLVDYNDVFADINMPFRIIGYDGASYRSQLLDDRKCIVQVEDGDKNGLSEN